MPARISNVNNLFDVEYIFKLKEKKTIFIENFGLGMHSWRKFEWYVIYNTEIDDEKYNGHCSMM